MLDEPVGEDAPRMGRPPKYKPEFAEQAAKLCRLGATDVDLADFFEVSIRTVERWRVEHEDFCRAVKLAKEIADDRVERSLYMRAVGYQADAVKIMQYEGSEVIVPYRENVQPDVAAQIFWLKNRRKDQWRDRIDQEHTHRHTLSDEFETFIRELKGQRVHAIEVAAEEISNVSQDSPGRHLACETE